MKVTMKLLVLFFGVLMLGNVAYAQTPQEELTQMVEQLQKSPNDNALREKIIKLAPTLKPSPVLPDTAVAFEGRAQFAFRNAKSEDDFLAAAREYEKAAAAAPWVPGYYADLCTIYEKAGKFEDAKRYCGFYLMGLTDPAQMTDIKRRIAGLEFGIEKANSPQARAAREKEAEQRFIASIEGARYEGEEFRTPEGKSRVVIDILNGKIDGATVQTWINPALTPGKDYWAGLFVGFKGALFANIPLQGRVNVKRTECEEMRVEIYDDRLVYVHQITFSGHNTPTVHPAVTCRRVK